MYRTSSGLPSSRRVSPTGWRSPRRGPPHDWVPPSSAAGATRLTGPNEWIPAVGYPAATDLAEALVRAYTTP
jgi:hypothetical protein